MKEELKDGYNVCNAIYGVLTAVIIKIPRIHGYMSLKTEALLSFETSVINYETIHNTSLKT